MTQERLTILLIGTVQAVTTSALAQDIYPLSSEVKVIILLINVALTFVLANIRSWGEIGEPKP